MFEPRDPMPVGLEDGGTIGGPPQQQAPCFHGVAH
jgi:hypothetical protein